MRGLTFTAAALAAIIGTNWGHTALAQQAQSPNMSKGAPTPHLPLEVLASQEIMVLPIQYVTFSDSLGWSSKLPSTREYLTTLDDELTFAFKERGLKRRWTYPADVARTIKRNPTISVDPYSLDAAQLRIGGHPDEWQLADPLASELRTLVALSDARYILFPVELVVARVHNDGQAKLHVVLIDARRSQIQWAGDIFGTPMPKFSPALAADVASHLADLVATPSR